MHVTLLGDFDALYFARVLKSVQHLLTVPRHVYLYVLGEKNQCRTLLEQLPKTERTLFKQVCQIDKVSFSYHHKQHHMVVLTITKNNDYLLHDTKALQGLLLHELLHLEQMRKGMYKSIQQSYRKISTLYRKLLTHLHQKRLIPILEHIGKDAVFLLKDLYTNSAMIERGYSHQLLRYYEHEFSFKKICPRPVFYEHLKKAVEKDQKLLEIVFAFEFALLSLILPFKKYKERHAKELLYYIERCYNLNMSELMRKCGPFTQFYLDHYSKPSKDFQEKYLHLIFTKVIELLT